MISLKAMGIPAYSAVNDGGLCGCLVCGAVVTDREVHSAFHREIVEWIRALRDGKADVGSAV